MSAAETLYLTPVARPPARLVFQDYEKKSGVDTTEGAWLAVSLHLRQAEK